MRYAWNCFLVGLFAAPVYCDEPPPPDRALPAVDYVVVLSVEVGSSGAARFDGRTYSEVSPLSHALAERMASDRRSAKTGGGKPIFNVMLLAHGDAKIGRVMLIQQALSKVPDCDAVSLRPAEHDIAAIDNTARDGLRGRWQPVFSERGGLHQVIDRDESFTFEDHQVVLVAAARRGLTSQLPPARRRRSTFARKKVELRAASWRSTGKLR